MRPYFMLFGVILLLFAPFSTESFAQESRTSRTDHTEAKRQPNVPRMEGDHLRNHLERSGTLKDHITGDIQRKVSTSPLKDLSTIKTSIRYAIYATAFHA